MKVGSKKIKIKKSQIFYRETQRGWAIVIMPNKIKIDNFHGFPHIHIKNKETIKTKTLNKVLNIVVNYISLNNEINLEDLKNKLNEEE